jgi:hypothetical protein
VGLVSSAKVSLERGRHTTSWPPNRRADSPVVLAVADGTSGDRGVRR